MVISDRLRAIRVQKKLSQGDLEQRCGLRRAYISRVENGYTVPSIDTLERLARALEVHIYHLFYDGEWPPDPQGATQSARHARYLRKLSALLGRLDKEQRQLLLSLAQKMAKD